MWRRQVFVVCGVVAITRLLAVLVTLTHNAPGWFFTKGSEMKYVAQSLLAGQGMGSPFGVPSGPTAIIAPLYPLLTAGVFRVFGVATQASALVIMLLQTIAAVLTVALLMEFCRRIFGARTARIAGWITALGLPVWWVPTICWDTSFALLMLSGLLLLAWGAGKSGFSAGRACCLGVYCALAVLMTPAYAFLITGVLFWMLLAKRLSPRRFLLAAVVALVVFAPWPLRNWRTFHAFIPLRTTVGEELWMGNHDGATGYLQEGLFPTYNAQELAAYRAQGEVEYMRSKGELGRQYIVAHPAWFTGMTVRRFVRFWTGSGTESGSVFFVLYASFGTLFAALGLYRVWTANRSAATLLTLMLLVFPLPYYITHAEFRYRLMIDPVVIVLAAYALSGFAEARHDG